MLTDVLFLMPLVVLIPLLAAMAAFVWPRRAFPLALVGAVGTTAVVGWLTAVMLWFTDHDTTQPIRHAIGNWDAPLGIALVLDGLTLLMLLLTAVVGLAITFYAHGYFRPRTNDPAKAARYARQYRYFWPLWLFLWAALNALFLSGDLFNLYVTLELLGFAAVSLTALAGTPQVLKAAMRYLLVSLSGSLMYLLGVVFLYGEFGVLDIAGLSTAVVNNNSPALAAAATLMTVGLIMKTALFPLHFWLPPAHANAAAPVSALLSALVVKGSFYILLRLWLNVLYPLSDSIIPTLLTLLGAGAIIWGSIQAIRQTKLKLLIAYSTVAQLGYLFLIIPLLLQERSSHALAGIIFFVIAHALAKSAAFLSAGNILYATGDDTIDSIEGLMRQMPFTTTTFSLAGVSLVALPPSAGFLAKWLMLETALTHDAWLIAAVILAGGLLAAIYIVRVLSRLFFDPHGQSEIPADQQEMIVIPRTMKFSALALGISAIFIGFGGVYLIEILTLGTPWLLVGGGA